MKRIAYFSPLNPIRSGISDYSEDLLPLLGDAYHIDIYIPNAFIVENKTIAERFDIKFYSEFVLNYKDKRYDSILYHMGNNYEAHHGIYDFMLQYPGIVILHDYSLHHFFAAKTLVLGDQEGYREEMFYSHGEQGLQAADKFIKGKIPPIWENDSLNYPMNLRVLDRSAGVIVHSEFAKNLLRKQASYVPIRVVPIPAPHISEYEQVQIEKQRARSELNIDPSEFVICSLGFANPTKRIDKILEALAKIQVDKLMNGFKFYIVGEISENYPVQEIVIRHKLSKVVRCIGFVDLDYFGKYIAASDICLNLRYPTQGESSASLLKIMGYGKPVIATRIGSFSEFPDHIVHKAGYELDEVSSIINLLVEIYSKPNDERTKELLEFTQRYHSLNACADGYIDFIDKVMKGEQININLGIQETFDDFVENISSILMPTQLRDVSVRYIDECLHIFGRKEMEMCESSRTTLYT
ncbi:glycosyltransferase family 4 protein [Cohnella lupini]|uniref:Glycosyltransferase involved in cell wall biosynthesis n=1 Tax=Cohnella lupini TaxID=1294267 RepID=A0A3D9I785_9BACL|nr:glycosyltransferase family 4 protein [Cohnella lupini]RED57638.1 glycosyltransferase involved in cell wall biosynthesis [Cohnella lupini]